LQKEKKIQKRCGTVEEIFRIGEMNEDEGRRKKTLSGYLVQIAIKAFPCFVFFSHFPFSHFFRSIIHQPPTLASAVQNTGPSVEICGEKTGKREERERNKRKK